MIILIVATLKKFAQNMHRQQNKAGSLKRGGILSCISSAGSVQDLLLLSVSVVIIRPLRHFWPRRITATAVS